MGQTSSKPRRLLGRRSVPGSSCKLSPSKRIARWERLDRVVGCRELAVRSLPLSDPISGTLWQRVLYIAPNAKDGGIFAWDRFAVPVVPQLPGRHTKGVCHDKPHVAESAAAR